MGESKNIGVDFEEKMNIKGVERSVHVFGECLRGWDKSIICRVTRVVSDGQDILPALTAEDLLPMKQRLWHHSLSARHPGGDCVEQEVGT